MRQPQNRLKVLNGALKTKIKIPNIPDCRLYSAICFSECSTKKCCCGKNSQMIILTFIYTVDINILICKLYLPQPLLKVSATYLEPLFKVPAF